MSENNLPKVAVIAVHGVAYHAPGASADAVSGLLLGLRGHKAAGPEYRPIKAEKIHIPLHPLKIRETDRIEAEKSWVQKLLEKLFGLEEGTSLLTRSWKSKGIKPSSTEVADDFMRLTLQDYRGTSSDKPKDARDADSYITTRLRTSRLGVEQPIPRNENCDGDGKNLIDHNSTEIGVSGAPQPTNQEKINVDVYEMYWADLSRPKGTVLSFFQALYQLLFHLASLSRLAISTGYMENKKMWQWRVLDRLQVYAVRMLTLPIPILNVILLATIFGALPRLIPEVVANDPTPKIAGVSTALLGIVIFMIFSRFRNALDTPLKWALLPLAFALSLGVLGYWISLSDSKHILLFSEGMAVGSYFIYASISSYDDVRDGANETGLWLGGIWIGVVILIWTVGGADSIQQAVLMTMQIVLAGLRISWLLLFILAVLACFFGMLAWRGISENDRRARAKAAICTSRFALAMPTLGILIVTLTLWSGLFMKTRGEKGQYGGSIAVDLFGTTIKKPLKSDNWFRWFILNNDDVIPYLDQPSATIAVATTAVNVPTQVNVSATYEGQSQTALLVVNPPSPSLSLNSATVTGGNPAAATVALDDLTTPAEAKVELSTGGSPIATAQQTITFPKELGAPSTVIPISNSNSTLQQPNEYFQGLLVWSVTPGFPLTLLLVIAALFILVLWLMPSIYSENEEHVPVRSSNDSSRRMGEWLSRGLDSTKIAACLAWNAAFILPLAFALSYKWMWMNYGGIWTKSLNYSLIHLTTLILEYMGIAVTSAAVLAGLAGSGSSVLGIILDVDNYLRTSPKDATPRARIMERYVSLLYFLSNYKDPADGLRYDRIVIVAHSLGALISADLLRFLKSQGDCPTMEIRLFTMGNPLRQLLNRFFPYLYEWINPIPDNSLAPLPRIAQPRPVPAISKNACPGPDLLEVSTWVNAYRSGDYVGRSLWLEEWYERQFPGRQGVVETIVRENPSGRREEMCIGAGAHQHYWDSSAPDIAEKLDSLISSRRTYLAWPDPLAVAWPNQADAR